MGACVPSLHVWLLRGGHEDVFAHGIALLPDGGYMEVYG